jgi:hypothetical protein
MSKINDTKNTQYRSYVLNKIRRGIERVETEGTLTQHEVEVRLSKFIKNKM